MFSDQMNDLCMEVSWNYSLWRWWWWEFQYHGHTWILAEAVLPSLYFQVAESSALVCFQNVCCLLWLNDFDAGELLPSLLALPEVSLLEERDTLVYPDLPLAIYCSEHFVLMWEEQWLVISLGYKVSIHLLPAWEWVWIEHQDVVTFVSWQTFWRSSWAQYRHNSGYIVCPNFKLKNFNSVIMKLAVSVSCSAYHCTNTETYISSLLESSVVLNY